MFLEQKLFRMKKNNHKNENNLIKDEPIVRK